jgi:predicted nucleotidyltransferase
MKENFGLTDKSLKILSRIFEMYPSISEVKVHGSRAKGVYNDRSDLDLVIMDELDRKTLGEIWMEINSSDFPLAVDLQIWKDIKNVNLKDHIRRVGKVFFSADYSKVSEEN